MCIKQAENLEASLLIDHYVKHGASEADGDDEPLFEDIGLSVSPVPQAPPRAHSRRRWRLHEGGYDEGGEEVEEVCDVIRAGDWGAATAVADAEVAAYDAEGGLRTSS